MYPYLGDFVLGDTVHIPFHTFDSNGASVTISNFVVGDIAVYKGSSMTQRASTSGYTLIDTDGIDIDGLTGIHGFTIATNDNADAGFWVADADYTVVVGPITVNAQTVNFVAARFSLQNRAFYQRSIDPPIRLLSGTTDQYVYFTAYGQYTGRRQTGLSSFTVYRSRNGGTATVYTTPTITEVDSTNMPGEYKFLIDEDMTLDAGDYTQEMVLYITATNMEPVTKKIEIFRRDVDAPVKNTALSDIPFYMVSSTDHNTPATGLTVTAQVSKDGGAFAGAAGTVTEIGSGAYQFDATAGDMNADVVLFKFTATGADAVLTAIKTVS